MDKANINQPLDLQEATRRDDVFIQMLEINRRLQDVAVYPSLLWAWTFDILKDIHENWQNPEINDEVVPEGVTLKEIFNKFWEDVDSLGFTMDQGGEVLEECILDWMRESGFLVDLDDLTEQGDFDSIEANQLQKGNAMQHEHYWDKSANENLVAECACGEQLERVQD